MQPGLYHTYTETEGHRFKKKKNPCSIYTSKVWIQFTIWEKKINLTICNQSQRAFRIFCFGATLGYLKSICVSITATHPKDNPWGESVVCTNLKTLYTFPRGLKLKVMHNTQFKGNQYYCNKEQNLLQTISTAVCKRCNTDLCCLNVLCTLTNFHVALAALEKTFKTLTVPSFTTS